MANATISPLAHLVAISGYSAASVAALEAAVESGATSWFRFPFNGRCVILHVDQWDGFKLLTAVTDNRRVLACIAAGDKEEIDHALHAIAEAAVPYLEG